MSDIYSNGFDEWLRRGESIPTPNQDPLGLVSDSSVPVSGGVPVVSSGAIGSGEIGSLIGYGKKTFIDPTDGWLQGLDSDNKFKWIIGNATYSIDWNVTTEGALSVLSGPTDLTSGTIAGMTISATSLTAASGGNTTIVSSGSTAFTAGPTGSPTFTVTQAGVLTAKSALIGNWSVNTTSIYTGTEDHSGYTANSGDITIYSDESNASIHAFNFYIDATGILNCTSAVFNGAVDGTSTVNGSTATNVQYRSEAFFAEDMVYIGRHNDGLTEATTNSTITRQPLCTLIANGGGATDQGRVISSFLGTSIDNGVIDWDEKDWEFYCNCETSATTNQDAFWGLFDRSTAVPAVDATDTTRHIGFYVQDGTIYASNADGTTQTKTDVSSGITLTNDNYYRFVYDVGVNIKFYINDVLVATHTTNMPTANTNDDPAILFWIANTAAEVKKLQFKNNYIVIARA